MKRRELVVERTGRRGWHYWRVIGGNNRIISGCTEGYEHRGDMRHSLILTTRAALVWLKREYPAEYRKLLDELPDLVCDAASDTRA